MGVIVVAVVFIVFLVFVLILNERLETPRVVIDGNTLYFGDEQCKITEVRSMNLGFRQGAWKLLFSGVNFEVSGNRRFFLPLDIKFSEMRTILQTVADTNSGVKIDDYVKAVLAGESVGSLKALYHTHVSKDVVRTMIGVLLVVAVLVGLYLVVEFARTG